MEVNVISAMVAEKVNGALQKIGVPPSNRIIILTLDGERKTQSGLIIPDGDIDGMAKRGVQVQVGQLTEEYREYNSILGTGLIVYYGDYAGKELSNVLEKIEGVKLPEKTKLRVLSINEIIYVQNNK